MKILEYDHSWVPKLHWLEVEDTYAGWSVALKKKTYEGSTYEKTVTREPVTMVVRSKPNWLGVSKTTDVRVQDSLDLRDEMIIEAFDKIKTVYQDYEISQALKEEKNNLRLEAERKFKGKLGG